MRKVKVVAVQPTKNTLRRALKTFVNRCRLTTILSGTPESQVGTIFLENFDRTIATATVQNQVLKLRILLLEHTENCLLDELTLVVRRCDNGKSWIRHRFTLTSDAERNPVFVLRPPFAVRR